VASGKDSGETGLGGIGGLLGTNDDFVLVAP
jgi:hypothetical protein